MRGLKKPLCEGRVFFIKGFLLVYIPAGKPIRYLSCLQMRDPHNTVLLLSGGPQRDANAEGRRVNSARRSTRDVKAESGSVPALRKRTQPVRYGVPRS